jgi:hypothetical protein
MAPETSRCSHARRRSSLSAANAMLCVPNVQTAPPFRSS